MAQPKQITSWSYSRWNLWDQCGYKAKLKFIEKRLEPGSAAMDHGNEVHKGIETYLKGLVSRVHKDWNPNVFGALLRDLRKQRKKDPASVFIEDTWAFRDDWSETTWDDWNGCWLRVKIDCAVVMRDGDHVLVTIRDWKTGRFRKNDELGYATQLDLYALSALMKYRDAKTITVTPSLVYIDEGVEHSPRTYTKDDLKALKKEWETRVKPMLKDTKFPPKPNRWCNFCHFRAQNNGPCKF